MPTQTLVMRMSKKIVEEVDKMVEEGYYASRSEAMRDAARLMIRMQRGMIKADINWRMTKEQKDEAVREFLKERGWDKKFPLK